MPSSNEPLTLLRDEIDTPIGRLALLTSEAGALHQVGWLDERRRATRILAANAADARYRVCAAHDPGGASHALSAYFAGELAAIDGLAVASIVTVQPRPSARKAPRGSGCARGEGWDGSRSRTGVLDARRGAVRAEW